MNIGSADERFMDEALELAEGAAGLTSPDPMVGAVIVKKGKIISRGYHAQVGTPHAESYALMKAGRRSRGATMYVNLEPCCHWGNNPPCVDLIIRAGIKRVVAAMKDPNPLVSGKGFRQLRSAGVKVRVGVLKDRAKKLNEAFVKHITRGVPFVTMKAAMSLDGKICTSGGESRWISSKESRKLVHKMRGRVDAVMVGIGTVLKDDPSLTTRMIKGARKDPLKIIIDRNARVPLSSKAVRHSPERTLVVVSRGAAGDRIKKLGKMGVRIFKAPSRKDAVDLLAVMKFLGDEGVQSVMIEGGGGLAAGAINSGIVDRVMFFIAPKIIGGREALTPVEGAGVKRLADSVKLRDLACRKVGEDFLIEGRLS